MTTSVPVGVVKGLRDKIRELEAKLEERTRQDLAILDEAGQLSFAAWLSETKHLRIQAKKRIEIRRSLRIVGVAMRWGDGEFMALSAPHRHSDLMSILIKQGHDPMDYEKGFVASTGMFLTRKQAATVARRAGQLKRSVKCGSLISEDVW